MLEYREGVTNWKHLFSIIKEASSIKLADYDALERMILDTTERVIEIYSADEMFVGYILIMNVNGERSLHGYKLIEGFPFLMFDIVKEILDQYEEISIITTIDKTAVRRLGAMLGLQESIEGVKVCLKK